MAERFAALEITTAYDLLAHLPFRYEDLREPTPAARLGSVADGEENALGTIVAVRERRARIAIIEAVVEDASGAFTAVWFGRSYMFGKLKAGMRVFVRGRGERTLGGVKLRVSSHRVFAEGEPYVGEIVPIYRATKDLPSRRIRAIVAANLGRLLALELDELPAAMERAQHFPDVRAAFAQVHQPTDMAAAQAAHERLIFGEFFALALAAALKRARRAHEGGAAKLRVPGDLFDRFTRQLPFAPTAAQARAIGEIWHDLARSAPMNRLLQGDVGSGKTLVAAGAVLAAAHAGFQSALMAPTEILAAQHAAKLAPLLLPFGITVEVLFGSLPAKARAGVLARIGSGAAALAVGTHALLTESVEFKNLALAIVDEQHRFGVAHRAKLRAKGAHPHTLHMTATPIPRTLAQTLYADLDVSVLDELPPGRTPVQTFVLRSSRKPRAYELVRKTAARGGQAYVVTPAIDESENAIASAIAEAEQLQRTVFSDLRVALLHGRLSAREQEAAMRAFVRGEVAVLIATTIIEVGVDVPNASLMIVLDAHRFGLAQLHQLRGRVGRGAQASYCVLIAPDDVADVERLHVLERTADGFEIAEEDLRLRAAGELAGTAQSGASQLRFGNLVADFAIYARAKREADAIVSADPELRRPEHAALPALIDAQSSARAMLLSS